MEARTYDVVVVGGGAAGSSAALVLGASACWAPSGADREAIPTVAYRHIRGRLMRLPSAPSEFHR